MPKNDYIEQVPIQRESTTVKKPLLDTGQRRIHIKDNKQADEVARAILQDAAAKANKKANGRGNKDLPLQGEHPELWLIPAAAEIKAAGLVPGVTRFAIGSIAANELGKESANLGQKVDEQLGTRFFAPTFGFVGGLGGYALGSGFTGNIISRIPRKYSYGPVNERTYWAEDQTPKYNSNQITGHFGKTKYYGPTMGKTTAVATNSNLVDFDDIIRQPSRSILDRFGFRSKSEMYNSGNQEAIKAYEDMLVKQLRDWRGNPLNEGKTLVASPTAIANPEKTGFYFDNVPSIPSRDVFISRNVARGGKPEASAMWYDSLMEQNPNLKIDDRFVSQIEYQAPVTREISISPKLLESVSFNSNIDALKNNIFKEAVERAGVPIKGQLTSSPTGMSILKAQKNGTYDPSYFGGLTLNPNYYYRRGWGIIDDALATGKIRVPEEGYIETAIKKYPWLDNGNPFSTTLNGQKFPYFSEETFWPSGGKFKVEPEDLIAIPKGLPWVNWVAGSKLGALKPYSKPSEFGGRATPLVDGQTNIFPTEHSLLFKLNPETKEYLPLRKAEYQAPQTTIKSVSPQMAYTSDFSGVENIESGNFGYGGVKPNLGLRKFFTERRAKQLLNSITEEQKRNASALNWSGKNWDSLTSTEQYWLKTLHGGEWNEFLIIPGTNQTGFLSLNEDYPKETMPMWKRVGHIVRKAQDDLRAMNSYHIQNVEEWNKLNEKNFKPISFRTDVGQTKILSDEEFDEFIKQIKTNGPISDPKRAGAAYIPEENKVYLRETGPSSNAYHEYLHQGFYGLRNPYVTEWRIGQLIDENKVKSLNPKQATYYLSTTEFPVHLRQNGENMGINVGDPYPGDEVFDKMLFDNPIFGSAHYVKRNTPEEKRLFWRALNGTLFGITGLSLMPHNNK